MPMAGTSEDVAMVLAWEAGATLIVAVGTHSNIVDFLEKGRKGMASTLLVRIKVGARLVDAKGVSQLYRQSVPRTVSFPNDYCGLVADIDNIVGVTGNPAIFAFAGDQGEAAASVFKYLIRWWL